MKRLYSCERSPRVLIRIVAHRISRTLELIAKKGLRYILWKMLDDMLKQFDMWLVGEGTKDVVYITPAVCVCFEHRDVPHVGCQVKTHPSLSASIGETPSAIKRSSKAGLHAQRAAAWILLKPCTRLLKERTQHHAHYASTNQSLTVGGGNCASQLGVT